MKYIKSLSESQFGVDFLQLQAEKHGMTREEWMAHYGSSIQGVDESFDSSTPNANNLGRYFIRLLAARDQAHVFHWQTQSFAQHEAFGEFYEEFLESVDDLVESIMGLKGRPVFGQGASILVEDYSPSNINRFFERLYPLLNQELAMICDTEIHEEIFDLARAITAQVDKLKYLMTLS
jgi:DNA-binding ferritin-like protein